MTGVQTCALPIYDYIERATPKQYIMALSHPLRNDPLHNVSTRIQCNIASLCNGIIKQTSQRKGNRLLSLLQKLNKQIDQKIDAFLGRQNELSEPQAARLVTQSIPSNTGLFVSSSMPIREIDMYGRSNANPVLLGANRGASGIDGTIASAIGFSMCLNKQTTLVIGDLAFLYDLNSLAMLHDLSQPMVIVVFNNNGGGIFSFLPVSQFCECFEKFFGTPHHLTFSAAADLFDLNYARPETDKEFTKAYQIALKSRTTTIIEIQTDRAYNLEIHQALQNKIKIAINVHLK